jgi:dTDP-4-dehydrorhamnose 3,5-epimerase
MKTLTPKIWGNTDLPGAWSAAREGVEPIFVPAQHFADDRGYSLMNQMQGVMSTSGQINYSVQYPGVVKAWHRHAKQTDFWICLMGHIKVGVFRESDQTAWLLVTGQARPGVVVIPPPLWHGAATVGDAPAGLLYYVTHAYDPKAPDEDRRAHDSVVVGGVGFPWHVRHG